MVYIFAVAIPPGNRQDKFGPSGLGVGNFSSSLVLRVGSGASQNTYPHKDLCQWGDTVVQTAWSTLWANLSKLLMNGWLEIIY